MVGRDLLTLYPVGAALVAAVVATCWSIKLKYSYVAGSTFTSRTAHVKVDPAAQEYFNDLIDQ